MRDAPDGGISDGTVPDGRTAGGRVVVGVDGSPLSHAAVRWAARLAARGGHRLEAVTVWELPGPYGACGAVLPPLDGFEGERLATAILDEALALAFGPAPASGTGDPPTAAARPTAPGSTTVPLSTTAPVTFPPRVTRPSVARPHHVLRRIRAGRPGPALVAAAEGAAALVLGGHGCNAALGSALGTVTHYCVHHALCTVVVVKDHGGD